MDRLASCYFCGAAADTDISEYPVVPRELSPPADRQGTVSLCPTCRQKLARIIDPILDTVGKTEGVSTAQEPEPQATPSDDRHVIDRIASGAEDAGSDSESDDPVDTPDAEVESGGGTDDRVTVEDIPVSTREFNRVMRLLGNREFPVDRSEFELVATNAYDVTPSQVDSILEVAVARGLIAEDEDKLIQPE